MNLPHPLDRPYQLETYKKILNSKKKFVIVQAPTGSGKTAWPAQMAIDGWRVLVCVMTKSLQWQYVNPYGFTELFGKGNYPCNGYGQQDDLFDDTEVTADLCTVPDEHKGDCIGHCEYPIARNMFLNSQAGIINYAKFLTDRTVINSTMNTRGFNPDVLVFDEVHELSDLTVAFSGLSLQWNHKYLRKYTQPISIDIDSMNIPLPIASRKAVEQARGWLNDLLYELMKDKPLHPLKGGEKSLWRWHKRMVDKVEIAIESLKTAPQAWFVYSDRDGITIKPKTAQFHFRQLFDKAPKIIMMSATIKFKDILSLGLEPDEFEFITTPNPYPPQDRPVYDLKGPKLTAKTSIAECRQHAQIIANVFNSKPDHWNGIVHMPSKKKSEDWGEWLEQMTGRPVYVPYKRISTDEAYRQWERFENENTGAIACTWNMMTGIDGRNINICVTACVPYPNFGNRFERARFDYNPGEARVRVANIIEQQQGRNRRGFPEHYGPDAPKFNAICDAKWPKLKSAFSKDFLASITEV